MNWTMLSVIAEILSSAAVLVTLIYLAIQTRQNADAIQANTRQAILDADQQFIMAVMASPELDAIFFKPDLTDDEKVRLSTFLLTHVRVRENDWFQYQAGVLDHVSWGQKNSSSVDLAVIGIEILTEGQPMGLHSGGFRKGRRIRYRHAIVQATLVLTDSEFLSNLDRFTLRRALDVEVRPVDFCRISRSACALPTGRPNDQDSELQAGRPARMIP